MAEKNTTQRELTCICCPVGRIDDQGSVRWQQLGKFAEGMTDVVNILEKVQMVCVNVQDNADLREKA